MKPCKKFPLSNEIILKLIEEVKNRECLWNPDHDNYNDRFHVFTAWREIAKLLGLKEDVLRSKWKNLRDLFIRQSRQYHVKSIEDYSGKWRHYSTMWFIHKSTYGSVTDFSNKTQNEKNEGYFNCDNQEALVIEEANGHFVKCETPDTPETSDREPEVYFEEPLYPIPEKRKKYNDDDYDVMYLKSLTPHFRQLDPIRKLVVRSKIEAMLLNEIVAQDTSKKIK